MSIENESNEVKTAVGIRDLIECLREGEVRPLEELNNVESALEMIKSSTDRIDQFKELKKQRTRSIDAEIETLTTRIDFFKQVIVSTLEDKNQKNVKFPGLGKASLRSKKGKWVVDDEEELIEILKKEKEDDTCVKTKEVIDKTQLNKLLDVWQRIDKLPKCVSKEADETAITLSYEKKTVDADSVSVPTPQKVSA